MKIYDGSTWLDIKALKLYDNAAWNSAIKGWAHDGTQWKIMYPNYPTTSGIYPSISGLSYPGATLTISAGQWIEDPSYLPTSYSYQWKNNNSNIFGANSSTYEIPNGYTGNSITCDVTATNARGSTTLSSNNSVVITPTAVTNLTLTDLTSTPSNPYFTGTSGGVNSWSASWSGSANYFAVSASSGTTNMNGSNAAYSNDATPGTVYVYVTGINFGSTLRASWNASSGATSYYVSWSGSANGEVTTTSTYYDIPVNGNVTVNVYPKFNSYFGQGSSTYGGTSAKFSSQIQSSGITVAAPIYAPTYAGASLNAAQNYYHFPAYTSYVTTGTTISVSGAYADGTNPSFTYYWQVNTGGGFYDNGTTGGSMQIGSFANGYEYRCRIYASNSSGSANGYTASTGPIVRPTAAPAAPSGVYGSNDNSPTGGHFYWTANASNGPAGVGSSYWNYSYGPTDAYDWYLYRSTTSGGTPTQYATNSAALDKTSIVTTAVGYFYFRIAAFNTNSMGYSSYTRAPASGTIQFT